MLRTRLYTLASPVERACCQPGASAMPARCEGAASVLIPCTSLVQPLYNPCTTLVQPLYIPCAPFLLPGRLQGKSHFPMNGRQSHLAVRQHGGAWLLLPGFCWSFPQIFARSEERRVGKECRS